MIKYLFSLLVISVCFSISCTNGKGGEQNQIPHNPDTIKTPAIYIINKNPLQDNIYRIRKDSLVYDNAKGKIWITRSAFYFRPFYDTIRNKEGKAIKDSLTGLFNMTIRAYIPIQKDSVLWEGNINLDSISKVYSKEAKK